jgi:LacI family transcriptional regulator
MTTLRDLSRHLGLSVTQVSRALNGHADVSAETRLRVVEAAAALRYQPNLSARKLVSGRSDMFGLVLAGVPEAAQDALFVQMVGGISAHFSRQRKQFVLHIAEGEEDILEVYRRLIDGGSLDGFILLDPQLDDPRVAFLRQRKVPFVVHGRDEAAPDYPYFDIDNVAVGRLLTGLLTARGHRRIAFLNGPAGRTYVEWRRRGHLEALAEAGIEADPALHLNGPMTEGFGLTGTMRLMSAPRPPTAIICGNMLIAKGALYLLAQLGMAVPGEVSVVAHDDDLPGVRAAALDPALTVTRAPLAESWRPLAELLLGRIAGRPMAELQVISRVEVVTRESVGEAPT